MAMGEYVELTGEDERRKCVGLAGALKKKAGCVVVVMEGAAERPGLLGGDGSRVSSYMIAWLVLFVFVVS
jgi:hypothetical protein